MKKNFTFIANWKMYLNFNEEIDLATSEYDNYIKLAKNTNSEIIICPSFLSLSNITQIFKTTEIETGAQNCSEHLKGSFTSQVSAESLNLIGSKFCIIGHSESRKYLHENENQIIGKLDMLIDNKISPILCIGENQEEHKKNETLKKLELQLKKLEESISNNANIREYIPIYIAYEPLWSIGTGNIPTQQHLENVFTWLFEKTQNINNNVEFKILYGGSVNAENTNFLKKIKHLDGFLIGKSSLDFQEFEKIVRLGSLS
ncbi:hypothetical protein GF385_00575 [Candidatus Dependentiae bacterium]|nr:hypothetical protein [Candidatus Dependentiae bacterium]